MGFKKITFLVSLIIGWGYSWAQDDLFKNRVHVFGSKDYSDDLFYEVTDAAWNHPFRVVYRFEFTYEELEINDNAVLYPYIAVSLDTSKSYIREDFADYKEIIGKTLLDILDIHRRRMLEVHSSLLENKPIDEMIFPFVDITLKTFANLIISVPVFDLFEDIEKYDDTEKYYYWRQSVIRINMDCQIMLHDFDVTLEQLKDNQPINDSIINDWSTKTSQIKESKPKAIWRYYNKKPFGLSLNLGIQLTGADGDIQAPISFLSVMPFFTFDLHYKDVYFFATIGGLSTVVNEAVDYRDFPFLANKRNNAVLSQFGFGYGFNVGKNLRLIPEVNFNEIIFTRSIDGVDRNLLMDLNASWGWGLHIVPAPLLKELGSSKSIIIKGYLELDFTFRQMFYNHPELGKGSIFSLGVGLNIKNDFYRKKI